MAWVRENKLTKRPDLKHTLYAYKPGVQHPAVAVAIGPLFLLPLDLEVVQLITGHGATRDVTQARACLLLFPLQLP